MWNIQFTHHSTGRLWVEQVGSFLYFGRGNFPPQRSNATDNLAEIAQRLHVLVNCPYDDNAANFVESVNAQIDRHNNKLQGFRVKVLRWLLTKPYLKKILGL